MAFRKKADIILAHKPDILVIPECEHPDKLKFPLGTRTPNDVLWFGTNLNKGLGVFSYSDFRFQLVDDYRPEFRMVIPIRVVGKKFEFMLHAIWANNPNDPDGQYVTQVWKAIKHYDHLLKNKRTVLAGDFNSNTIWDRPRREGNHSTVVDLLQKRGIHSVYHKYFKLAQGKEKHPTLYLYKKKDKPYHIDYCFVSEDFAEKLQSVEVGKHRFWTRYSDHVPVIATFKS
jgi:exonuclease III